MGWGDVSNAVGAARFAMNPTALGGIGLAAGLAQGLFSGSKPWNPSTRLGPGGVYQQDNGYGQNWQSLGGAPGNPGQFDPSHAGMGLGANGGNGMQMGQGNANPNQNMLPNGAVMDRATGRIQMPNPNANSPDFNETQKGYSNNFKAFAQQHPQGTFTNGQNWNGQIPQVQQPQNPQIQQLPQGQPTPQELGAALRR